MEGEGDEKKKWGEEGREREREETHTETSREILLESSEIMKANLFKTRQQLG